MRPGIWWLAFVLAGHVIAGAEPNDGRPPRSPDGAAASLERFLTTDAPLTSYRGLRTLEATTRGGRMHARITASTWLDPVVGFQYSIVDAEGSETIRRRVLLAALEAERSLGQTGEATRGALTVANYQFSAASSAENGLERVMIHPKRRDTMLIEGSMLLTRDLGDLVQVEGLLVKRPSVWTRRVEIVRRYARIGGFRVPVSTRSTADVLLVGKSTFSMTYEYESINGDPVAERIAQPAAEMSEIWTPPE